MLKNKIPNITNLATTTALIAVQNKILNVSNLVKKSDDNTKISEIATDHDHDRYITTQKFNKVVSGNFTARLAQVNLARKKMILLIS